MDGSGRVTDDSTIDLAQPLKVYWQPGCSSCLRTKEFLTKRGVSFVSINAVADATAFADLARLGLRRVPIVVRGEHWADGQVLQDVARVAGIPLDRKPLLPARDLLAKGDAVIAGAHALLTRVPEATLEEQFPGRNRSHLQLGRHVFHIFDLFLDQAQDGRRIEVEEYLTDGPAHVATAAQLLAYGDQVGRRLHAWGAGVDATDFSVGADVYYGEPTLHEFFERTVSHAAQHTRQVEEVLRQLGLPLTGRLDPAVLAGLDIADGVYDDKASTT